MPAAVSSACTRSAGEPSADCHSASPPPPRRLDASRDDGVKHRVVGVAADSRYGNLRMAPQPIAYMPMKPPRAFTLYVRSVLDANAVAAMVGHEAAALGLGTRVRNVTTL